MSHRHCRYCLAPITYMQLYLMTEKPMDNEQLYQVPRRGGGRAGGAAHAPYESNVATRQLSLKIEPRDCTEERLLVREDLVVFFVLGSCRASPNERRRVSRHIRTRPTTRLVDVDDARRPFRDRLLSRQGAPIAAGDVKRGFVRAKRNALLG